MCGKRLSYLRGEGEWQVAKEQIEQIFDMLQDAGVMYFTSAVRFCGWGDQLPAGLGLARSNLATLIPLARPSLERIQMPQKLGSISYQVRP